MKGRTGKRLRQEGAINRIELTIEKYEKILPAEKELLKLMRKEKDLAEQSKFFAERQSEESARVEIEVDLARERARERIQMEMYDDPYLNWSGHR